ncbi:hypothetical protein DFQ27_009708 [Actinomortierella ambigua]|uniref:Hyaluronan/mRNA-binding protein domain-containing protein n=1 Tax=Actinomortierella ambigua TaxID=1343610 RepID=A0A9P6QI89_9FUNG|nr:hypothetical protein DFQ26_001564 [Actinomortierella ambigua]KAG0266502.1 hypothetical protein DFQ27_009708 [Actinomortierella ambigua]
MASTNPFTLLNDDAQDQEIQVPAVKKETKPAVKPAAATSAPKPADNRGPRRDNRGGKPRDGDDRAPRGPRFDRAPRDGAAPRERGARQHRAPRNGREFDRHSGTGIADSKKKEKQGWGNPTTAPIEGGEDAAKVENAEATEASEAAAAVEPEPAVKTLDDYLAEKAAKALKVALPEARAANAGADQTQWKDAVVLEVEETGDFIKMGKHSEPKSKGGKGKKEKQIVEIDMRFNEPAREPAPRDAFRGARGRGGNAPRGAPRGGAPRGGAPRGGASRPVNVNDTELFPTLGSK